MKRAKAPRACGGGIVRHFNYGNLLPLRHPSFGCETPGARDVLRYAALGDRTPLARKLGTSSVFVRPVAIAFSVARALTLLVGRVQRKRQPPPHARGALVEITHFINAKNTMGYINDFRGTLRALIEEGKADEAVKFAADTVLESYRNGLALGSSADKEDVRKANRFVKRGHTNANAPRRSSGDAIT